MVLGIDASQANRPVRSGTEWYAFYLIRELTELAKNRGDIEIRLYTRDELQSDLANGLPDNFKIKVLRWPLRYFWGQVRLSMEMLFSPPDILFCPAHAIPLIHPKKTFTTLHDVGFEDYPELYDKLSLWYHRWAARLAVKSAYHIFTVSEFSKERIIENYALAPEKITVTYLGSPSQNALTNAGALKKYKLAPKQYLFYIGRLEPKKNILNLVKAFEMADATIPLVLAGRKIDIRDVEEFLKSRPKIASMIKFLDYITEQEKTELYRGAAALLFPTLYEGFGLPILEAQAAGTVVITSNTASNPEIAGKGALLVDPDSPYGIAAAIKKLLSSEDLRRDMISAGFENLKRFNWRECGEKTWTMLLK